MNTSKPERIESIDIYRGLVMFLMMAEVLRIAKVASQFPGSSLWTWLGWHTSHVAWRGCSVHDMIQPSFTFLVGVALPFSLAARLGRGQSFFRMAGHALWRSLLLIGLGIILRSIGKKYTYFTFEDTLTQIGLGYFFVFLLAWLRPAWQMAVLGVVLVAYFAAFALFPLPNADFSYAAVGVPADWPHHANGFAAHWNKNSNLAWAFDKWFLNLFGRESPFEFNRGGYATLSFIPTLGTMILGLLAGNWLKESTNRSETCLKLFATGTIAILLAVGLDQFGICPNVKRIWTPSWVLFSGGICFIVLCILSLLFDRTGVAFVTYPIIVIGANSIVAYVMAETLPGFLRETIATHLGLIHDRWGYRPLDLFGKEYQLIVEGGLILLCFWFVLWWLYRNKTFIRI
ncbi:MAG: hypothetical protein R3B84_04490 [Zavarzinella sp.]